MNQVSNWQISANGQMRYKGWSNTDYPFHILYLDDHKLIRTGIKDFCIYPFFPFANFTEIGNGTQAFLKVKEIFDSKAPLHLIITDISHPGLRGDEFVIAVRKYEKEQNLQKRVPILIISMFAINDIKGMLNHNLEMADIILTKASEGYEIAECVETLLLKK